jgi:hypothetical protein
MSEREIQDHAKRVVARAMNLEPRAPVFVADKLRIVEWSQSLYADMPEKCWTIVDDKGRDVAGTFWNHVEATVAMESMLTDDEKLSQADPTVRHPEGF